MEWGVISGGGHVVVYGDGMDSLFGWESGNGGWGSTNNYDVYVAKNDYTGVAGLFKTVNDYVGKNTFATLAHPNLTDYNNLAGGSYNIVADSAIVGSSVESGPATTTNTTYSSPGSSMSYLWYYQTMLSKGYHLGPTIDHDNHNTTFGHTTYSRTAVIAPALTKRDLVKAMRDMHFYATQDCDSKVDFTINTRIMGSVFSGRNAPAISVTLSDVTTTTSSAVIRVMFGKPGNGIMPVKIDSVIGNTLYFVDESLETGATGYYYVDITNGTSRIITSPIWYTRTCNVEGSTTVYSCGSYEWNGQTYTESGTYSKKGFTSLAGCDSTAVLYLTITTPTTGDTTAVACDSFTWYGTTYTTSGEQTKILKERGGCDSTVTLHLTVKHSTTSSQKQTACDSYLWHGAVYNTSGDYIYHSLNEEGCTHTDTLHLTIQDVQDPAITAPLNVSVNADNGKCYATNVNLGIPVTSDNCGVAAITNNAPANFLVGETTITWTVTDTHGRTATASQTVTVIDNQNPTITSPSDILVNADNGSCSAASVALGTPVTSDNCSIASVTNNAPSSFTVGQTIVTWTATDTHGRTATAVQTVIVKDDQIPTISCPPNQIRLVNNTNCSYKVTGTEFDPTAFSDNCPAATITNNFNNSNTLAGASFPRGTTVVTWTVADAHGKTANCTMSITINSTLAISIQDVYAVQPGGAANTIYIGYGPNSVTLNATVTGGTGPYSYKWTTGSSAGAALGTNSSFKASPGSTTTYYLNVKDAYGCSAVLTTKTIQVVDVRCGAKLDKVTVCVYSKGSYSTNCVSSNTVSNYLANGDMLGLCLSSALTVNKSSEREVYAAEGLEVRAMPNPSSDAFRIQVQSNTTEKISISVSDILGKSIEQKLHLSPNTVITIGSAYQPGVYIVEVIQGTKRQQVKLIKLDR